MNDCIIISYNSCQLIDFTSMNQGIYFGQAIIGPAGSGKVELILISRLIAKLCNKWHRPCIEI